MARRAFSSLAVVAALLSASTVAAAPSRRPFYGTWLIAEAHPAPWHDARDPSTAPFDDHLVGKSIVFTAGGISGPRPLACRGGRYQMLQVQPDTLFQGALTDPTRQAAALGFRGSAITTLETGCAADIAFHFLGARTALFALNNLIYTLRKQGR